MLNQHSNPIKFPKTERKTKWNFHNFLFDFGV